MDETIADDADQRAKSKSDGVAAPFDLWAALHAADAGAALILVESGANLAGLDTVGEGAERPRHQTPLGRALDILGERLREREAPSAQSPTIAFRGRVAFEDQVETATALIRAMLRAGADPNAFGWIERPSSSFCDRACVAMPTWMSFFRAFGAARGGADQSLGAEVMRAMIDGGLGLHGAGPRGETPLHHAAALNLAEVASMLLAAGARPSAADDDGETPLHRAAKGRHAAAAKALLDAGADPLACDSMGESVEDVARIFGGAEIWALVAPRAERARLNIATPRADKTARPARL